ncbi:MAG: hypothetical protein FJ109_15175, partial [Deltaproteobacteria bacterium]|nr:hypothetical protein [Deltaproteobacteria bacterium]
MSTRLYLVLLAAVAIAGCGSHDARHDALEVASDRASMDEVEHDGDGPAEGLGEGLTHLLNDGAEEVGDLSEARNSGEVDELLLQDETEADTLSCDCPPPALSVTVNRIPVDMNGSVPFLDNAGTLRKFHLALPTYGFAVDLDVVCPCGCDIDGGTFSFDVQTGEEMPGANHWELAEWTEGKGGGAVGKALTGRLWVGEELELDEAEEVLLTGTAVDLCGKESEVAALQVETVEMTPLLHPFDIEDPWLLTYHRDHYAIQLVIDDVGSAYVTAKEGANGIDDFIEDLWMAGMGTPYPSAEFAAVECDGGTGP